jgi:hypothetical protein
VAAFLCFFMLLCCCLSFIYHFTEEPKSYLEVLKNPGDQNTPGSKPLNIYASCVTNITVLIHASLFETLRALALAQSSGFRDQKKHKSNNSQQPTTHGQLSLGRLSTIQIPSSRYCPLCEPMILSIFHPLANLVDYHAFSLGSWVLSARTGIYLSIYFQIRNSVLIRGKAWAIWQD